MEKEVYLKIAIGYRKAVAIARDSSLEQLRAHGIYIGAMVKRHYDGAVFEITEIDFYSLTGWLSGRKMRKDNSFGTHEHPIGRPDDVKNIGYKVEK